MSNFQRSSVECSFCHETNPKGSLCPNGICSACHWARREDEAAGYGPAESSPRLGERIKARRQQEIAPKTSRFTKEAFKAAVEKMGIQQIEERSAASRWVHTAKPDWVAAADMAAGPDFTVAHLGDQSFVVDLRQRNGKAELLRQWKADMETKMSSNALAAVMAQQGKEDLARSLLEREQQVCEERRLAYRQRERGLDKREDVLNARERSLVSREVLEGTLDDVHQRCALLIKAATHPSTKAHACGGHLFARSKHIGTSLHDGGLVCLSCSARIPQEDVSDYYPRGVARLP